MYVWLKLLRKNNIQTYEMWKTEGRSLSPNHIFHPWTLLAQTVMSSATPKWVFLWEEPRKLCTYWPSACNRYICRCTAQPRTQNLTYILNILKSLMFDDWEQLLVQVCDSVIRLISRTSYSASVAVKIYCIYMYRIKQAQKLVLVLDALDLHSCLCLRLVTKSWKHKGSHPERKVQFFLKLFKKPFTHPLIRLNIMWWIFLEEF